MGFAKWSGSTAWPKDLARWQGWKAGTGLQAEHFPAFDIDVADEAMAEMIADLVIDRAGDAPARTGRPPRRLLPYRTTAPITKRRLAFTLPGSDETHAVELLGAGQQYVIDGVHPKTAQPYTWNRPLPAAAALHAIDAVTVDAVLAEICALVELFGGEIVSESRPSVKREEGVNQHSLLAPSEDAIAAVLDAAGNDADYDTWIKIGVAIKAASAGSDRGREIWCDWSALYDENAEDEAAKRWDSFSPPYTIGWPFLQRWAAERGVNTAQHEFDEVPADSEKPVDIFGDDALAALFSRYVWVHTQARAYDTETREVIDREQFNVRNNNVGDPADNKKCAWSQWRRDPARLRQVNNTTYRPGLSAFITEESGECVNTWRPALLQPAFGATDADVKSWLDHARYLYPDDFERNTLLDWLAFVIQCPTLKPNWAVLMGSLEQGIGKDLLVQPVIAALGRHNVGEIGAEQVIGRFNGWCENRRLVIVQEMESFGTRSTADKLKPLTAPLPAYIEIEKKGINSYSIPNTFAMLFFSNNENAMQISDEDRRYFIAWSNAKPRPSEYYGALAEWYSAGGAEKVAGWLLARDLTGFKKCVRPPMTEQKRVMQALSKTQVEAWVAAHLRDATGPLACDLICPAHLAEQLPANIGTKGLTPERMASVLRRAGLVKLRRVRLAGDGGMTQHTLYAARNAENYLEWSEAQLSETYARQREDMDPFKTPVAA